MATIPVPAILCSLLALMLSVGPAPADRAPEPAAGPEQADSPRQGRSLFDILMTDPGDKGAGARLAVPFPYERLREKIVRRSAGGEAAIAETLFPLGRSLQRHAAAPAHFRSPRIVLGASATEPTTTVADKPEIANRLFVAYQPAAETLEIISYNDMAGRFEFQLVHDYAEGQQPRVVQASRPLCLSCHQHGGPIFPAAPWRETPNNAAVAERLSRHQSAFHGVSSRTNAAGALHDAVLGAFLLAAGQRLWHAGCDALDSRAAQADCRITMLRAAIRYRLDPERGAGAARTGWIADLNDVLSRIETRIDLPLATPIISDRDPLAAAKADRNPPGSDPLEPRPPWQPAVPSTGTRLAVAMQALGGLFTRADIRWIERHLMPAVRARSNAASRRPGRNGLAETLAAAASWRAPGAGRMITEGAFRRRDVMAALASQLGRDDPAACCGADPALPPPVSGRTASRPQIAPGPAHPSLRAMHRQCGACHAGPATEPPNFLYGAHRRQLDAIARCAARILTRTDRATGASPMPPAARLAAIGQTRETWLDSADRRRIRRFAAALGADAGANLPCRP